VTIETAFLSFSVFRFWVFLHHFSSILFQLRARNDGHSIPFVVSLTNF